MPRSILEGNRILIVGASGLLGSRVFDRFKSRNEVVGTSHTSGSNLNLQCIDATKYSEVEKLVLDFKPNLIINCAGLTDVDVCESQPEYSWLLNVKLPANLARTANLTSSRYIQISTDHFENSGPTSESDDVLPVNVYGFHKLLAESIIDDIYANHIIIRTNFFGLSNGPKDSFFNWILKSLENRVEIKGFKDIFFTPVGIEVLIDSIEFLVGVDYRGKINVSASESLSKFEFITRVARLCAYEKPLIIQDLVTNANHLVSRPKDMSLSNRKLEGLGMQIPTIDQMISMQLEG